MSRIRYEFEGRLQTLTPTRVGSGGFRQIEAVKGKEGVNASPEVAAIVRDALERPYIPATTIKGLLRRLAEELPDDPAGCRDELFGVITSEAAGSRGQAGDGGLGQMGALLCRGAEQVGQSPDVSKAPFADREPAEAHPGTGKLGPGVFVAARTRIDSATGVAKDSSLFFQEMVAAETTFKFRCLIDLRGKDAEARGERLAAGLIGTLSRLAAEEGASIGKGQADGFGRVRLANDLRVSRYTLDNAGDFTRADASAIWQNRSCHEPRARDMLLSLSCDGPFAILDASHVPSGRGGSGTDDKTPQLMAQRLAENLPLVLGSSISGALRARARWLAALEAHRSKKAAQKDLASGDAILDVPVDRDVSVLSRDEALTLNPVERLFEVTGFRGLLGIEELKVDRAEPWDVTSVKLDRFSGAPIDNALFTTTTFVGVRITLRLRLATRAGEGPTPADTKLFDRLLGDIKRNGLQLGHGDGKGFGWFSVEERANA